ncbi:hypothetical protein ACH3XW_32535 [Acanthocheilonema viteae]|uniref:Uncharacterized protein n=1 Tax=Acanthocheilonema viteae TaxID=6277 RepID=A0A498S7C8_ACAVI|nr:unnamed protein product [Acanthocheilonema viteae]
MGCRFSRTNDKRTEITFDSTDLASRAITRPLLGTTENLVRSQSIVTSNTKGVLNPTTASDKSVNSSDREMITTPIDCIKSAYSLAHWDTSIRSTFCNRTAPKPKISSIKEVQESNTVYVNKPISQIESTSQIDFFRMLDEKIAQGPGDLIDSDTEK